MYTLTFFSILYLTYGVESLYPFDPWSNNDNACKPSMDICTFQLEATVAMTMFYKQLFRVVADPNGTLYKFNNQSKIFDGNSIITGDGYPKLVYVFNNTLPGPVLHVYQGQEIFVQILNNLPYETISVHFHGIRQVGTPFSDGVGHLTQLPILPSSSFQHKFIAIDQGTFWYHSHMNSQTGMGLLGAFIVHSKVASTQINKEFTLVLQDWQHFYTDEQHQFLVDSGQFYPNSIESLMTSDTIDYFQAVDGSRSAEALVTSILINGRGQYFDPRNNQSSSTPFENLIINESPTQYLIRLINGGNALSMVFSIDEQRLQIISSDSVPLAKPIVVDQVVVGLGERYDLLVNITPTSNQSSWWIRVNTLDKNNNPRWDAKAILQVGNNSLTKPKTNPRNCSSQEPCYILNCPFKQYGSNSNLICLTMENLTSDSTRIDNDLISDTAKVTVKQSLSLIMTMATDEMGGYESINHRSLRYPPLDQPIIYVPKIAREKLPCSNASQNMMKMMNTTDIMGQKCYNNIMTQFDDIVELFVVNLDAASHPMHLHGAFFHVLEQGFPQLNDTTGFFLANNPNIMCDENQINCKCLNCTTNIYLVKDTLVVPRGGYIRIRFRANNPGIWLFHCHTETHLARGMALTVHIAEDRLHQLLYSTTSIKIINNRLFLSISMLLIVIKIKQIYFI